MTTETALQKKFFFIVYAALKSVLCIGLFTNEKLVKQSIGLQIPSN